MQNFLRGKFVENVKKSSFETKMLKNLILTLQNIDPSFVYFQELFFTLQFLGILRKYKTFHPLKVHINKIIAY